MSYNYFKEAPKLATAFSGAMFNANKSTQNINFQQEMKFSAGVAADSKAEIGKMKEYAQQMKERALADGGQVQGPSAGRQAVGMAIGEGLSYGAVALGSALMPAAAPVLMSMAAGKTAITLASKTNQNSYFTQPQDIGKGASKADRQAQQQETFESSGGSQTSFSAVAKMSAEEGGVAPIQMMPDYYEDGQNQGFSQSYYGGSQQYDQMYQDLMQDGLSPDDVLKMSMEIEKNPELQALERQYQQHAVLRQENLRMVATGPSAPGLS